MQYNSPYETQREFWIAIYNIFGPNVHKFDLKTHINDYNFAIFIIKVELFTFLKRKYSNAIWTFCNMWNLSLPLSLGWKLIRKQLLQTFRVTSK